MINLNQINIIEEFIPSQFQNYLYKKYTKNYFWRIESLDENADYNDEEEKYRIIHRDNHIYESIEDTFQFSNVVINKIFNYFNSDDIDPLYLSHYIQLHLNYQYGVIPIKLKSNLQVPAPNPNKYLHNTPHIDIEDNIPNAYTLIYYVNDSDGDTIIFNEMYNQSPNKKFTINQRITPKMGKAVIFPTHQFHCGSNPINTKARIVINYNFQLIPL